MRTDGTGRDRRGLFERSIGLKKMSRKRRSPILLCVTLCAALAAPLEVVRAQQDVVVAVERAFERMAASREYWPGFAPATIPLAVYDGERTFLFRHPAPPDGFESIPDRAVGGYEFAGRHPAMIANTSAQIGGVVTATLMLPAPGDRPVERLAAVALHESFHVYQRMRHPRWAANEADLFVYPVDDAEALATRRLESRALRAALAAESVGAARCWAGVALAQRARRYAAIGAAAAAYERGTELNEGLANYVEVTANGAAAPVFDDGADTTDVRRRAYSSGAALAMLLDRLAPGWKEHFDRSQSSLLDTSLSAALSAASNTAPCELSAVEIAAVRETAHRDVAALLERRRAQRAEFDTRPGWRITVVPAKGEPLWPKGFDPLNATVVEGGVLHTRFLKIGNDSGELEAMETNGTEIDSLTIGAGRHPLFDGLRRVVILGSTEPVIERQDDTVTVRAPGIEARFRDARVSLADHETIVQLGGTH